MKVSFADLLDEVANIEDELGLVAESFYGLVFPAKKRRIKRHFDVVVYPFPQDTGEDIGLELHKVFLRVIREGVLQFCFGCHGVLHN